MKGRERGIIFYSTRIAGVILVLAIYLFGLRPVRRSITQQIALPIVTPYFNNPSSPYTIENKGTALTLTFEWNENLKTIRYQPQLGFFFLIAVIALIFITLQPRWYLYLAACHILAMVVVLGVLFFSRHGWYPGFIIVDFFVTYFIPGLSFAYVAVIYHINKKGSTLK